LIADGRGSSVMNINHMQLHCQHLKKLQGSVWKAPMSTSMYKRQKLADIHTSWHNSRSHPTNSFLKDLLQELFAKMTDTTSRLQSFLANNKKFAETWKTPPTMEQMRALSYKSGGALLIRLSLSHGTTPNPR